MDDPHALDGSSVPADPTAAGDLLDDGVFAGLLGRLNAARPFARTGEWVAGEDWAAFKQAFKRAEADLDVARLVRLLPLVDGLHLLKARWRPRPAVEPGDERPGEPPAGQYRGVNWPRQPGGEATAAYLKRRGRRLLRRLAAEAPAVYVPLAAAVLAGVPDGPGRIDLGRRWLAADILFGGGTRVSQARNGRGRYVAYGRAGRLAREERAPSAWDAAPAALDAVFAAPDTPLEAREMALRALRAGGRPVPPLAPDVIDAVLDSPSPMLVLAARDAALALLDSGADIPADLAARAWLLGNAAQQASFPAIGNQEWRATAAVTLLEWVLDELPAAGLAGRQRRGGRPRSTIDRFGTRRGDAVLRALTGDLLGALPIDAVRPRAGRLLAIPGMADLVWSAVAGERAERVTEWFGAFASVPEADRERFGEALGSAAAGWRPSRDEFQRLVSLTSGASSTAKEGEYRSELAARWDVAARADVPIDVLEAYWQQTLERLRQPSSGMAAAQVRAITTGRIRWLLDHTPAGATLDRVLAQRPAFLFRWKGDPLVVGRATPEQAVASVIAAGFADLDHAVREWPVRTLLDDVLRAWVGEGTPTALLAAAGSVNATRWKRIAPVLLAELAARDDAEAFYLAAWDRMLAEPEGLLANRLPADKRAVAGFLAIPALPVERANHPNLERLALRWLAAHPDVPPGSARLFALATSPLAGVRAWGLAWVRAVGAEDGFLLRLLESRHPEAMAVAGELALDPARPNPLDLAVAAIDSPDPQTRSLGWEIAARRELPPPVLVARLAEHPDPGVQAEVARLATGNEVPLPPAFARSVVRGRNRARRAKDVVQRTAADALDAPTLLEIARGATPQDAEWALAELARRALAGESIDGLAIDGVAGV